ncbi:MAG TPA: hypothetical protein VJJ21_04825 [Candidatus Nanoarchaeia archaeon]|nr:hypothetical protein [Candidatus Nanoarchaeia archaeon]
MSRTEKLKEAVSGKYLLLFFLFFFAYLGLNFWINQIYVTLPTLLYNNLRIIIPYIVFTLIVAGLTALTLNLIIIKTRELKRIRKSSGFAALGLFGGLLGGACPSCFVGLFPAVMGLFGVTANLSRLPFFGVEILIGSAALLILSVFLMTKDNVCKVKY